MSARTIFAGLALFGILPLGASAQLTGVPLTEAEEVTAPASIQALVEGEISASWRVDFTGDGTLTGSSLRDSVTIRSS